MQMIEKIENNEDLFQRKYALIVVGRMGHGKSSFCKMIVNDSDKPKVQAHVSIKSGTSNCQIYFSNRFNDVFEQDIVVIDTPGIDSKTAVSLIVEDIDDLIIKYKLHIAGIAYVIDVKQREQNQQGSNYIFALLDFLRIRYSYKINLAFCVLSKFDKYYEDEEEIQELMSQFSKMFEKNKYIKMWERNVRWMSQPVKDQKKFHKKINGQLKSQFQEQYIQLRHILKQTVTNKQYLNYQSYEKDRIKFEEILKKSLTKAYGNFQFRNKIDQFGLNVEITQVKSGILKQLVGSITLIGGGSGTGATLLFGAAIVSQTTVATLGAAALVLSLTSVLGLGFFGIACAGKEMMSSKLKGQISQNVSEQNNQLNKRIQFKLKGCLIKAAIEQIQLKENIFSFKSLPYITKIEAYAADCESIPATSTNEEGNTIFKASLKIGINRIKFFYKTPSISYYEEFLKEMSKQIYGNLS